ncbi:hypothetical protein Tco_1317186 [Tanacetum coccineum]
MLAIDGVGFDWSDMAEEQVQTNMALITFSDSELNQTEFTATTYKRGLATLKEQLITYRKNTVPFSEEVGVFKREVACKDYEINVLKSEFEKVKQEKEGIEFKIKKFDKASKYLDKLLESHKTDKSKKGLGYSVVPLPHPLIYNRPKKLDLSYSDIDEFKKPEFKGYGSKDSKIESNVVCDKKSDDSKENSDNSLVKEQVSKDTSSFVESSLNVDKETVFLLIKRVNYNYTTKRTHPNAQRNIVPRAVLMKIGLKTFNTTRTVNTAHPKSIVFSAKPMSCFPKTAQSTVRRPFQSKTALSNKRFTHKVNTAKAQAVNTARPQAVNTARPKIVKTARPNSAVVNAVNVNQENAIKASASLFEGRLLIYIQSKHGWKDMLYQKVSDEVVHKELSDRIERAATTASSLEAEPDSGSGPRCQDTMLGDVDAQTRFETTSIQSNDPPLSRGYTLGSGKDNMKLLELMELCTKLSKMLHKNR